MKRQIPGLHGAERVDNFLEGLFLARVDKANYNWHRQSPFFLIRFTVLEPKEYLSRSITGRIYCTPKALWRLHWFLRDFGYDTDLLGCDEVDEKALLGLRGVIRTSRRNLAGRSFLNLTGLPQQPSGRSCRLNAERELAKRMTAQMIYSFTQLSQYLRCPRSYRHRYLDGWKERDTRAAMIFGRCFEQALAAYLGGEDGTAVLFREWGAYRDAILQYGQGESWDKLVHQGVHLLHIFAQDDRVRVPNPKKNLQVKMTRSLPGGSEFVSYIDALGELDREWRILDWKTTSSRYPEEPEGLLSLDPQLVCYSWVSGIREAALVVFVRKRLPEIQYLKATITDAQQKDFGELVTSVVSQIEAGQFHPHSGIRFPMNGCTSCSHLGLCLGNQTLVEKQLIRQPGASELDWLESFDD